MWKASIEYPAVTRRQMTRINRWISDLQRSRRPAEPSPPELPRSDLTEADLDALEQRWLASAKQRFLNAQQEEDAMGSRLLHHGALVTMGCYFELKALREKAKALSAVPLVQPVKGG